MLSANFNGTERHAVELANELSRRGEVALLLRARPAEPHRHAAWETLRAAVAPGVQVTTTARTLPWLGLWTALRRFRPHLIHAHYDRSVRVATRCAAGVPVLATVHVRVTPDFLRCDGLVCLSDELAREVPASYPGLVSVVGNWVLPHPRPPAARLAALRAGLGVGPTDYVVGSVGRLSPVKGMAGLLRAFAAAALPEARLVIAGEGEERAGLESLAAELGLGGRVVFAGFRRDIRDLYWMFDLFVLNSTEDPYPLAVLEAAQAGVPVIASATVGGREQARLHPLRLVPVGDAAALAVALRQAWAGRFTPPPPLRGFSVEDRVDELTATYRHLLQRHASRPRLGWPFHTESG
jgi:glycosyltransferase involved in cell wall biosynthesis